jgi:hypothetical protein
LVYFHKIEILEQFLFLYVYSIHSSNESFNSWRGYGLTLGGAMVYLLEGLWFNSWSGYGLTFGGLWFNSWRGYGLTLGGAMV